MRGRGWFRGLTPVVLLLFVVACAPDMGPKETGGTMIGAGTGALLGSQIGHGKGRLVAVAVGTLAGALIGQGVGRTLDQADRAAMQRTAQQTLEKNPAYQPGYWRNPDSGNEGSITPTRTYRKANGQYCREYTQVVMVAGEKQQAYGTACRETDGSWRIVN